MRLLVLGIHGSRIIQSGWIQFTLELRATSFLAFQNLLSFNGFLAFEIA